MPPLPAGQVLLISLLGGLIGLDRRALFQGLFSHPLIAGTIVGACTGNIVAGAATGLLVSLLWLNYLPLGTTIPPDDTLVALAGAGTTILIMESFQVDLEVAVTLSILLLLPAGYAGIYVDYLERRLNTFFSREAVGGGDGRIALRVTLFHLVALFVNFSLYIAMTGIFIYGAFTLEALLIPGLPPWVERSLETMFYLLPLLGLSVSFIPVKIRRERKGLILSFSITLLVLETLSLIWR